MKSEVAEALAYRALVEEWTANAVDGYCTITITDLLWRMGTTEVCLAPELECREILNDMLGPPVYRELFERWRYTINPEGNPVGSGEVTEGCGPRGVLDALVTDALFSLLDDMPEPGIEVRVSVSDVLTRIGIDPLWRQANVECRQSLVEALALPEIVDGRELWRYAVDTRDDVSALVALGAGGRELK